MELRGPHGIEPKLTVWRGENEDFPLSAAVANTGSATREMRHIGAGSQSSERPDDDVQQYDDGGAGSRNEPEPPLNEVADRLTVAP